MKLLLVYISSSCQAHESFQASTSDLPPQETPLPAASTSSGSSTGRKVHPRPISISASGKSGQLRGFEQLKKPKDSKSARQAIFETGNVGLDLRAALKPEPPTSSTTFLKPAGVDDPKDLETRAVASSSRSQDIIEGARQKKPKRERDLTVDDAGEAKKPKKKKLQG